MSLYSEETAKLVCHLISTNPVSLHQLGKDNPDFPCRRTINNWRILYPEFELQYLAAKKNQSHLLIEQIIEIIDDPANIESEVLAWSKERIRTRQWIAVRLLQKIYGDNKHTDDQTDPKETLNKIKSMVAEFNKTNDSEI